MKECKECKVVKSLSEYAKDKHKSDGHVNQCKQCRNIQSKQRYEMKKPEITEKKAAYRAENRGKAIAISAAWAAKNPSKRRAGQASYRARKRGACGTHTADDIALLMRLQRGCCAACGAGVKKKFHVDHVTPLVLGGANDRSNLQLLCPTCNCRKGPKDPVLFAQQIGRLL